MPSRASASAVILWAAFVVAIPNVRTQNGLPVYQVVQSGATPAQARGLAADLGVPFESLSLSNGEAFYLDPSSFMVAPALQVTDATIISNLTAGTKNDYSKIPLRFEQIDFSALGKWPIVSSNTALNTISTAFDKENLLPQFGAPFISHTMLTGYYSNENNVVISNGAFLDTSVKYQLLGQRVRGPNYPGFPDQGMVVSQLSQAQGAPGRQGCMKFGSVNAGARERVVLGFIFQIGFRRMNRRLPLQRLN